MLVCAVNWDAGSASRLLKLYGDPDDYAFKLGNSTFADRLPIHKNIMSVDAYDLFHSVSIDYQAQRVYFGNNAEEQLERGLYVYNNRTEYHFITAVPKTNQVTQLLNTFIRQKYINRQTIKRNNVTTLLRCSNNYL